eukprot:CAMPEP_0118717114 /NCGR_PEP_ID=MMETSP0800-20121206/27924_1 /TAXON_ID=210618 ORGANISM="Striatella unipunctata, Strain CCMP2910" /NCGR_SAMPLE_ID=MMETSP0800 /ASSEMBLY_ACC=CAM_ASM_000638 /LENGTH=202 /DNA_ID=CAMNT_0006623705 /DNA_START=1 /DNA_END=609 /DNA_ORIENTATION=+
MISGGPPLNVTGGLYQMGMIMSKFAIGKRLTVMDGFRPGFFSLQVKSIGFYKTVPAEETNAVVATATTTTPETLSKSEVTKKRPLLLKLLFPILGALFSEKANRRKSAVKLLQQKRGLSRLGVINYGIKLRTTRDGLLLGLAKTGAITLGDTIRTVFKKMVQLLVFKPLSMLSRAKTNKKMMTTTTTKNTQEQNIKPTAAQA